MGTASTMACITAALALIPLQGGASTPALSAARLRVAERTGVNAVLAAKAQRTPQTLLSVESFCNAAIVLQAIEGSANAMVHLMAMINRHTRLNGSFKLQNIDLIGQNTPLLVDLKPSGDNYMTDFHKRWRNDLSVLLPPSVASPGCTDDNRRNLGRTARPHSLPRLCICALHYPTSL